MGCFVPAEKARIGLVDRIFTRIGAADDIASGLSTFMVEMNETASILKDLTGRSLILLDEIGRGTSTYDGLSIAWAVAEYLHESPVSRPKTLFATHYHELTELAERHRRIQNLTVLVKEHGSEVVFLRKIREGSADRSYGIYVASLAGLPAPVVERAGEILKRLEAVRTEEAEFSTGRGTPVMQLKLFEPASVGLRKELQDVNINELTPLEALRLVDEWRKKYS
jgi:DNA mismatch repair protein MutS